ncbi:hypothetical protein AX15_004067 [Amanita polypyramis BW_CC]|nr:hypothetical protein AX15_004067 [Amanita polypyramis BW_CC]
MTVATLRPLAHSLRNAKPASYSRYSSLVSIADKEIDPVDLEYTLQTPPDGNTTERPLVILHGLFGSKRNWGSLTKAFKSNLKRPVYALDLRNHGSSPHVAPMTNEHMAADVLHFLEKHQLHDVSLLGHSMGGKVAMTVALSLSLAQPDRGNVLSDLIVADIAPTRAALSEDFVQYTHIMSNIEQMGLKTRTEASKVLEEYEKDIGVRQFLLTNLIVPPKSSPDKIKFQVPLSILKESIEGLGLFPYSVGERSWPGRTLVIKGSKSKYINKHNIPVFQTFFPNARLETLEAGHWVHAEKPHEFTKLVENFIRQGDN